MDILIANERARPIASTTTTTPVTKDSRSPLLADEKTAEGIVLARPKDEPLDSMDINEQQQHQQLILPHLVGALTNDPKPATSSIDPLATTTTTAMGRPPLLPYQEAEEEAEETDRGLGSSTNVHRAIDESPTHGGDGPSAAAEAAAEAAAYNDKHAARLREVETISDCVDFLKGQKRRLVRIKENIMRRTWAPLLVNKSSQLVAASSKATRDTENETLLHQQRMAHEVEEHWRNVERDNSETTSHILSLIANEWTAVSSGGGPEDELAALSEQLNRLVRRVCGKRKAPEGASSFSCDDLSAEAIDPGKAMYKRFMKNLLPHVLGMSKKANDEVQRTTGVTRQEIARHHAALSSIISAHEERALSIAEWYDRADGMVASKVDEINSLVESTSDFVGELLPMCAEAPPTGGKTTEDMMKGIEWLLYDASQLAGSVHALEASVRRQEEDFLASLEQPRPDEAPLVERTVGRPRV